MSVEVEKLSIIIPAYNEARTLARLVERIHRAPKLPLEKELIVIDDASTDGTNGIALELLREEKIQHLHRLAINQGKGRAVREGLRFASGDIVLIQDADLEYSPSDYAKVLAPILNRQADVVFGSRFERGTWSDENSGAYFFNTLANHTLTFLSNQISGLRLSDIAACYKAFRREVLSELTIEETRFGIDAELVMKCAKLARDKGVQLAEVGIGYRARSFEEGKKIRWRDGFSVLRAIWKYR
ncbi:MAG: glycosyltransferase family 2 protein [Chloroherpetonaceae bacterium]